MFGNNVYPQKPQNYICESCDFSTSNKKDFNRHNQTKKHKLAVSQCFSMEKPQKPQYECHCGKQYKDNSGLWRHKSKGCSVKGTDFEIKKEEPVATNNSETEKDDLINYLMKENQEFKNLILEIVKKDTHNNCNNTTTHTNSHNKAFNLNFFLNETCKDAMNIMDFVDSIKLQLSDLEKVGELGYVEGISNIIVKNLNELDVTQRPVHCTDKKRETMYIKDEDKWEKDESNSKIKKAIKRVASKNQRLLPKF